jgi:hypothetical protein
MQDILPDSRPREVRGARVGKNGVWWIPIFCPSCGADAGWIPEVSGFAFWLCQPCFDRYGAIAGTYAEPDTVFWARVQGEMDEKYGRVLTLQELQSVLDADSSPLASLLREGPTT